MNHEASDDNGDESDEDDLASRHDKTATNRHGHPKKSRPHHDNGESEAEDEKGERWMGDGDEEAA